MELHTLSMILAALGFAKKDVKGSRISVLGVTYKRGCSDTRYSPSKYIIQELLRLGAQVNIYDPFCGESFGGKICSGSYEAINNSDCLVILTDHDDFASLDLKKVKELMSPPACIVDGRRMMNPSLIESIGIRYFGVGYGKDNKSSGEYEVGL
jgi:UDP-N-acetyl-D-mannosaminuronate dehydrogenase